MIQSIQSTSVVAEVEAGSQLLQEIEEEITLRTATEQEQRLANLDRYYSQLLAKVAKQPPRKKKLGG